MRTITMYLPNSSESKNNKTSFVFLKANSYIQGRHLCYNCRWKGTGALPSQVQGIDMSKETKAGHLSVGDLWGHLALAEILVAYQGVRVKTQAHSLSKEMF